MSNDARQLYDFGEFRLDVSERLLSCRGVGIPLTPKAIGLLLALVDQPGRVLDKETLLRTVWPDSFVEENNLADNIFKLRRVLGDGKNGRTFIETVPKRGYRFVAEIRTVGQLTEPGPDPAQEVVAEQPRQSEQIEGQNPLPAKNKWSLVSVPWWLATGMTVLAFALGLGYGRRGTPESPRILNAELLPPENASFGEIALSPDGKWLAFTAATGSRVQLWLRSLEHGQANPIESTEGASHPFWSPDSRFVGFFAGGKLQKIKLGDARSVASTLNNVAIVGLGAGSTGGA